MFRSNSVFCKFTAVFIIIFLILPVLLCAQESSPDVDEWEDYSSDLYVRGDQTFIISLGTTFPLMFFNNGKLRDMQFSPPVGGAGSLSYNYFLSSRIFTGGEIALQFMTSVRGDTLFIIPLGARLGYQFNIGKIDIPISAAFGMCWHRFLSSGYYGIYARAGVAGYYKATSNWSFGLTTNWYWLPEWTKVRSENMDGHMLDVLLSARYHF